ncbi:fumarylacetoacetate hydrolase family protein [Plantibacter flavus]|uniref:fumarylacetoacetate hydrolase family protein n=1 Tax=Plantibacter flavus TaxID=150123 RepID=UPI003F13AD16
MKIARFSHDQAIRYGIIDDGDLVVLDGDPLYSGFEPTGERVPLADATLLAPVIPRSKVVAVGKNYHDHAAEMGGEAPTEPLLFLKPNTSVVGPGDSVIFPKQSNRIDFEGELAIVIGGVAKNVSAERADEVIFGYTIANDVTARDLQESDGQWARAKGFDTFCPLGPFIETEFSFDGATIETRVDGEVRQRAPLSDMVHSIGAIVEYASSVWTLLPGDVILTGTPAGVGEFTDGQVVEVEISGIGILRNTGRRP